MSAKTLIIATAALAASTAMTLPAFAAGGDGTGPNPPAATQTVPVRAQIMFNLLDTNHDGAIDKDEFAVISTATFDALDHQPRRQADAGRAGRPLRRDDGPARRGGPGQGPGRNWQDRDGRGGPGMGQGRMDDQRGPGMMGRMGFFNWRPRQRTAGRPAELRRPRHQP